MNQMANLCQKNDVQQFKIVLLLMHMAHAHIHNMIALISIISLSLLIAFVATDIGRSLAATSEIELLIRQRLYLIKLKQIILNQDLIISGVAREEKVQLPDDIENLICSYL